MFNMASYRSNIMTVIWVSLIFLSLVSAPGIYEGSGIQRTNYDYEYNEDDIEPGTLAYECLRQLKTICGVHEDEEVLKDNCLKNGVFIYSNGQYQPDYIIDYFEMFRSYMNPGNIQLPDEFCENEDSEFTEEEDAQERQIRSDKCIEHMQIFRDLVETPQGIFNNLYEMKEKSRYNILYNIFYETTLEEYTSDFVEDYFIHVSKCVQVSPLTHQCLNQLKYYCGVLSTEKITKDRCLKDGVRNYPRRPEPPYYVTEYFEMFRTYMYPGNIQLPNEYCEKEAREFYFDSPRTEEEIDLLCETRSDMCKEELLTFEELVVTPEDMMDNVYEMEEKSRYNVLYYMFYETTWEMNRYATGFTYSYMVHMSKGAQVSSDMPKPVNHCIKHFPIDDN